MNKPAHNTAIDFTMGSSYPSEVLLRMSNIERFNDCAARLFAMLFENFPFRVDLQYVKWLTNEHEGDITHDDLALCQATVEWLAEAGYITVGSYTRHMATRVSLTPKGLEVLKAVPESLDSRQSVGDALLDYAKGVGAKTSQSLMSTALTEGFKIMVRLNG